MTLDGITLPDGLVWADEFDWTAVAQKTATTITGALLVQEGEYLAGRPITLKGSEESCWAPRSVIEQLYAMTLTADRVMTLDLGGTLKSVIWLRGSAPPVEAVQLLPVSRPLTDALYVLLALRFLEVA